MDICISIIMPLYNAEKYLTETLESIIHQTYSYFELICVNDCSIDSTERIVYEYMGKDERIKIINLEKRQGAAHARNVGMNHAKGKYVIFLDGDDLYHSEMLARAYDTISSNNAQVAYMDYMVFNSDDYEIAKLNYKEKDVIEKYKQKVIDVAQISICDFLLLNTAPDNKLCDLSYLKRNNIFFQEIYCCNDVYYSMMSYFCADKIAIVDSKEPLVCKRMHVDKDRIANNQKPSCGYEAMNKVFEELSSRGLMKRVYNYFYSYCFISLYSLYVTTKDEKQKNEFGELMRDYAYSRWCLNNQFFLQTIKPISTYWDKWHDNTVGDSYSHFKINIALYTNKDYIVSEILKYKNQGKTVALWGIGKKGKCLLNILADESIRLDQIIDQSDEIVGTKYDDYFIYKPDKLSTDVIISSILLDDSVKKKNKIYVNLDSLCIN